AVDLSSPPQPAYTAIYTLSLHDALPISSRFVSRVVTNHVADVAVHDHHVDVTAPSPRHDVGPSCARSWSPARSTPRYAPPVRWRSEEHTSELQSRENLVCRLLLEKKNKP